MEHDHHEHHDMVNKKVEYVKLLLIIGLIAGVSAWLNSLFGSNAGDEFMRWFMGMFFVTFATFKFIGYEMFTEIFPEYDIIASKSRFYTYAYPFIELMLGTLYLINAIPVLRDIATIIISLVGAYGIYKSMKDHPGIQCACLGNIIKLPLSTVSLSENLLMAVMAIMMLII